MPISVTKNRVSEECIRKMVQRAFGDERVMRTEELTEGFFNAAYRIDLEGRSVVLKIAPPQEAEIMTHEKNIMFSEVESMRMAAERTEVPVAGILFYDRSRTVCQSDYFFMEMIPGSSFSGCMEMMSPEEKEAVYFETGKYNRMLNGIRNDRFGYFGQPDKQGDNWYEVFRSMVKDTYCDAGRKKIRIPVAEERLLRLLEADRTLFEMVKSPKLVHWDLWAGNIFVKDGSITGLIDFERCLWGDELMEVGFRTYGYEKAFFDGYGINTLSREQKRRAEWYDIYLFLINCLECDYRMYENRDIYDWGSSMLVKWTDRL